MFASRKKTEAAKAAKKTVVKSEEKTAEPVEANLMSKRPTAAALTTPKGKETARDDPHKLITAVSTPEILVETPIVEPEAPVVSKKGAPVSARKTKAVPQKEKAPAKKAPAKKGAFKSQKIENTKKAADIEVEKVETLNFARKKEDVQGNIISADQDFCASSVGISNDAPASAAFSQAAPGTCPGGASRGLAPIGAAHVRLEGASKLGSPDDEGLNLSELRAPTPRTPRDHQGRTKNGAAAQVKGRDAPRTASQDNAAGRSGKDAPGPAGVMDKLSVGKMTIAESSLTVAGFQGGDAGATQVLNASFDAPPMKA